MDFKTKFETVEPEPVFEEEVHEADEKGGSEVIRQVETGSDDDGKYAVRA